MKHIVSYLYAEYGRYIDSFRAIPKDTDCLKPVERRLLLSVYEVARKKLEKSAKVIGTCIGNYHPHGDCLDKNTKIFSLDGNIQTIEELYLSGTTKIDVIGMDKNNNIIPVKAHSFRIGQYTKSIFNINLLDGSTIKTTNNHQFNTLNRGWVSAENLKTSDTLVAIAIKAKNNKGYINLKEVGISSQIIDSIVIDHLNDPIPMYDFTVDNYENMFIVGNIFENGISLINVHNSSTYDALVGLVQRGFVDGQGNWGRYGLEDSRAAAYRYTECKSNENLTNIFSDYLNFVPWEPLELENEPLYIPFPVPLGLIGSGITTGIGFHTTKIPRFDFKDLVIRLVQLLEKTELTTIIPKVDDCTLYEDSIGEFENLLTTGKGRIQVVPNTIIKTTEVIINGRNPLVGFNGLKSINEKYEETNGTPLFNAIDVWDYKCKTSINIKISSATKSKLLSKDFTTKVLTAISSIINFKVNVVENNVVILKSIDQLLLEGYDKWKFANLKFYEKQLDFNKIKLEELQIIQVIRDILKNNPTLNTINDIIKLNTSQYSDDEIRKVCNKHNIKTLIEAHIDINSVMNKINSLNKTISNIDNVVLAELKQKFLI